MAKKTKQGTGGDVVGGVNLAEVERLLAFMQKHNLEEFEYQQGDVHIRLRKPSAGQLATATAPVVVPGLAHANTPASASPAAAQSTAAAETPLSGTAKAATEDLHIVKSPIVGTFYSASGPDADPFVSVGGRVSAGQVLCIIEAMKLMNEIEADVSGEVVRIFAENGHPVEYGQPLFGIRAAGKK